MHTKIFQGMNYSRNFLFFTLYCIVFIPSKKDGFYLFPTVNILCVLKDHFYPLNNRNIPTFTLVHIHYFFLRTYPLCYIPIYVSPRIFFFPALTLPWKKIIQLLIFVVFDWMLVGSGLLLEQ